VSKPLVFRLYPEKGRTLYVRVVVHDTLSAMRARSQDLMAHGISADFVGRRCYGFANEWVVWNIDGPQARRDPCVAEVNLARRYCTIATVAHELLHATFAWARRVRLDLSRLHPLVRDMDIEERICDAHDALCEGFTTRATAAGLFP